MESNFDLENIITPVNPEVFERMLIETNYDESETRFVINGFKKGFDLHYEGPTKRCSESRNIPFTVGNRIELWNKLMKEVKNKRVAGPFNDVPFQHYIQSPIGLVPKAGGDQTRLIFHLSYQFEDGLGSVNAHTPPDLCSVKYNDLDHAVRSILLLTKNDRGDTEVIYLSKGDLKSAFRVLPLSPTSWAWLIMKAQNPVNNKWQFFVDKCLPFGASISCSHFQRVSNALAHIVKCRNGDPLTNYLDDFLFFAFTIARCNYLLNNFLEVCREVGFPVAPDKIEWASELMTFLGILLDGRNRTLSIPLEKRDRATYLLKTMLSKTKATVKDLQILCGYLNFINKAVYPGRAFTRRMYAKYSNCSNKPNQIETTARIKPYHHVRLDYEFKSDCKVWLSFLTDELPSTVCRPMIDLNETVVASEVGFSSDASGKLGFGAVFGKRWIFGAWDPQFLKINRPSIEYLELFGLCAGILTWAEDLKNCRIIVHCDNQAVVAMINNITSGCPQCMILIRKLVLNGLHHNRRIFARYITTRANFLPDALSRLDFKRFRKLGPHMNEFNELVSADIWPVHKVWRPVKRS